MTIHNLISEISQKQSFLCIGLDTDPARLPAPFDQSATGMLDFNRAIIESTSDLCVAYKINTAFYEAQGSAGWKTLEDTVRLIPDSILRIADAKRGDIGNSSEQYANAFFDSLNFDAITVSPYMGLDSVEPFLKRDEKWTIILAATSNPGARDFQFMADNHGQPLYEHVVKRFAAVGRPDNLMFVVGATKPQQITDLRAMIPDHFMLVPGVGAQDGDLDAVCNAGLTAQGGLLINSSRSIIYAGAQSGLPAGEGARQAASGLQAKMASLLSPSRDG